MTWVSIVSVVLFSSTQLVTAARVGNTIANITWPAQPVRASPMIMNYVGAVNLVGGIHQEAAQMIGLGPITMAPFNANFQNSTIRFDGKAVAPQVERWTPCEGVRASHASKIDNAVRMPFKQRAAMQQWKAGGTASTVVAMFLDGPYARQCDANKDFPCGWATHLPVDRADFTRNVVTSTVARRQFPASVPTMVTKDQRTGATTVAAVWLGGDDSVCVNAPISVLRGADGFYDAHNYTGYGYNASVVVPSACTLYHAFTVGGNESIANDMLSDIIARTTELWDDACTKWASRFEDAFTTGGGGHFSGNLPTLETDDVRIERLYGWAATAMVALEREGYPSFPRQFVISEGPSNSFDGSTTMGGSGQFTWDLSFNAVAESLLDPASVRVLLKHIIANTQFELKPIAVPQAWDGYPAYPNSVGAGQYCFDYIAAFLFVQSYVTVTGDVAFLTEAIPNSVVPTDTHTPLEFLRAIAWAWKAYPPSVQSKYLVDYGSNKRDFLEAVSTYIDVIAALQAGNAGMLLSLARLLEQNPSLPRASPDEITELRSNGTRIAEDMVKYQYVPSSGAWQCLKAHESEKPQEVRCIADTVYVALASSVLAGPGVDFPLSDSVRDGMQRLFYDELLGNGWVRAISLKDPTMANINCQGGFHGWHAPPGVAECTLEDLVGMRADWTASGGYGGLAGAAVDAMAILGESFNGTIALLHNLSTVADPARGTMPAQGIATMTPPFMVRSLMNNSGVDTPPQAYAPNFPEFFDEPGWGWTWPRTERAVQNAEASIVDAVIRSLFGWRPDWGFAEVAQRSGIAAAVNQSLFRPTVPRDGFTGTLRNVRLPGSSNTTIDITAGSFGLRWKTV